MQVLRHVLGRLDLDLNETKTRTVDAQAESFDFLGFSFQVRRSRKSGKHYPHVEPSKRSVQRIRDRTKQLTDRQRTPVPLPQLIGELNRTLRGWSNYFHHRNCTGAFSKVKMHVEERVRTQRRRRHQLFSRAQVYQQAYQRFPGKRSTDVTECSSCRRQRPGERRMPWREEHRKAVYGKTVCTV
jgi:RNA-directed DNA polymerase